MKKEALAMIFTELEKPFSATPVNLPNLTSGEALVEITYTTICTSDLHTFYGRRAAHTPSVLGHEVIGRITRIAEEGLTDFYGDKLKIGDLVTWSVYAHDHTGMMAAKGIPQKSEPLFKYGHEQIKQNDVLSGGFATHCHLRKGTDIFKIPSGISSKEAAPLNCTHATIAGAIRLAGSLTDKNVLVIGAGMLGISACAMSKFAGAKHVFAMDRTIQRIENSTRFGADRGIDANLSLEEILSITQSLGGIDIVIDTTGSASAMEKGLNILNIGGIAIWVGAVYSERNISINAESVVRRILTIKGLHNYSPEDLAFAINFLESTHLLYPFESLVETDFCLAKLDDAFKSANKSGKYRVGITPN
ncbi:zinc-binding dehydrogenase [Algoriphagus chordae]|uniref:alcohol dehydrogenase n=1 Tax=Algoriphagus chordae TaxID=237019 RepID=A0A2W7R8N7_9BACT|nr:zinc-binding dehydrogenase [Algoriphagus chordae]PZX56774.1 putative phosphonate catabolism associated alcohol dehydrogenase [Algoriphagus chordae]